MSTIAAISTAAGTAALGVIRLSGPKSKEILSSLFRGPRSPVDNPRMLCYGHIVEQGEVLDEVMAVFLPAPQSFTTEDMAEFTTHGGRVVMESVYSAIIKEGARIAERGEFSRRAFLNGRLDLAQAEAILEVIEARTKRGASLALSHLEGDTTREIKRLREELLTILAQMALAIDYPEESSEEVRTEDIEHSLHHINVSLEELIKNAHKGHTIAEGLRVAILGRPNVGKSSLLNALSRRSRSIVTNIPGTTRDTIEETIQLSGVPLILIDTAGLRQTDDPVEILGVRRSREALESADMLLILFSKEWILTEEEKELLRSVEDRLRLLIINKTDLDEGRMCQEDLLPYASREQILEISISEREGLEELEKAILKEAGDLEEEIHTPLIANVRQKVEIETAALSVKDALQALSSSLPYDYVEVDVRGAYEALGRVLGEGTADIMDEVFGRFCVGK